MTVRTITYSAISFHITMLYRRSSVVMGRCRTTIIISGSDRAGDAERDQADVDAVQPAATGGRRCGRRPASARDEPRPNSTISASFGRSEGNEAAGVDADYRAA